MVQQPFAEHHVEDAILCDVAGVILNELQVWQVSVRFHVIARCDVGFDLVMEQFDSLGPNIAESMLCGLYKAESFGTFIGIKTEKAAQNRVTW